VHAVGASAGPLDLNRLIQSGHLEQRLPMPYVLGGTPKHDWAIPMSVDKSRQG
jgi:hypothetical protein